MKIGDITKMIEDDSVIDQAKLDLESVRIPYLHAKYYKIMIDEFKILKGIELEYNKVKKERSMYYMGKCDDAVYKEEPLDHRVLKADLDLYLNADEVMSSLEGKRVLQKAKVDMLESFIKTLSIRGYQIKNAIEFMKFKSGA